MSREDVERRSRVLLVYLAQRPKPLLLGVVALLVAGALFGPLALGVACWAVLLGLLAWLSYLSWPALPPRGRAVRLVSLSLLVALAAVSLSG